MIQVLKQNENAIKVIFPFNPELVMKIKSISGRKWNPDGKYWIVPNTPDILNRLLKIFENENIHIDPELWCDQKKYDFPDLMKQLTARKYSPKTQKAYLHHNKALITFAGKSPSEITNEDITDYLVHLSETKNAATATINQTINALKFYYGEILKKKFIYEIVRPKKDKKLPVILSKEEIAKIINSVDNLKHKTILMTVYSAGLRVSEVVKLRPEDIDSKRMLIFIKGSKGRKDRYTLLSETALKVLQQYLQAYKPKKWLFEGANGAKYLSTRTVQAIFEHAKERSGIKKEVSVHSLRHSFATHLLEGGTDLRYIQEILGHAHSKTTEIYTHVSTKNIGKIKSPLDSIKLNE